MLEWFWRFLGRRRDVEMIRMVSPEAYNAWIEREMFADQRTICLKRGDVVGAKEASDLEEAANQRWLAARG